MAEPRMDRRAALRNMVGGVVAGAALGAELPQAAMQIGVEAATAGLRTLADRKNQLVAQAAPAKLNYPNADGIKARFITDPAEVAEAFNAHRNANRVAVAHADSEVRVGNIIISGIPDKVNTPQAGPDVNGMAGSGEFFVPHGPHYSMGTAKDVITLPTDGEVTLILGKQHQIGQTGEPGFSGYLSFKVPGNTMLMTSMAEAGEVADFAMGRERREIHSVLEQWDRIEQTGGEFGNWVADRIIKMYDDDPGEAILRVRRGHNRLYIAPMLARQFPWTQLTGYDQIQPANHTNYLLMHRANDGKTWGGEVYLGAYSGQRRNIDPATHTYRRLHDNYTGLPTEQTNVKPINPIRL